jgi:hypothetical protein
MKENIFALLSLIFLVSSAIYSEYERKELKSKLSFKPKIEIISNFDAFKFEYSLPIEKKLKKKQNIEYDENPLINFKKVKYIEITDEYNDYKADQDEYYENEEYEGEDGLENDQPVTSASLILRTNSNKCYPNPCNSGRCHNLLDDYICKCPPGLTGRNCDLCNLFLLKNIICSLNKIMIYFKHQKIYVLIEILVKTMVFVLIQFRNINAHVQKALLENYARKVILFDEKLD